MRKTLDYRRFVSFLLVALAVGLLALALFAPQLDVKEASALGPNAIRTNPGFSANIMPDRVVLNPQGQPIVARGITAGRTDDGSTPNVLIGFTLNYFGFITDRVTINNNGNLTFGIELPNATPFDITRTAARIIAPFFADVNTRFEPSGIVRYGTDVIDGRTAFGVTWNGVGYYRQAGNQVLAPDKFNYFQVVLIDRSDTGSGNFDIEFNYDQIQWEEGSLSSGREDGLSSPSSAPARAGFSSGTVNPGTSYEIIGSSIPGAFLDSNTQLGLVNRTFNANGQLGRYVFNIRSGLVSVTPTPIPGVVTRTPTQIVATTIPTPTIPPQTCAIVGALPGSNFTVTVPPGVVPGSDAFCRVIARDGSFLVGPQEIGNQDVINLGVVQAVDVFSIFGGVGQVAPFTSPIQMCLRGTGSIVFLSAAGTTRTPTNLAAAPGTQGFTCASVPGPGTVVLVQNAPGFPQSNVPLATGAPGQPGGGGQAGGGQAGGGGAVQPPQPCRITTNASGTQIFNAPDGSVIATLPYVGLRLDVTGAQGGWFQIALPDGTNGWIPAGQVTTSGAC